MFSTEDVENYYDLIYRLTTRKDGITWTELENMTPFDRDIYLDMLIREIEKEQNKDSNQNGIS